MNLLAKVDLIIVYLNFLPENIIKQKRRSGNKTFHLGNYKTSITNLILSWKE